MLKKKYRLNLSAKLESPTFFRTPFFTLLVSKNNLPYNRYGYIASKKNSKKAVERNRAKRVFRALVEKENIKEGFDMLFILKKEAFEKESGLSENIQETLRKAKFI